MMSVKCAWIGQYEMQFTFIHICRQVQINLGTTDQDVRIGPSLGTNHLEFRAIVCDFCFGFIRFFHL